jgi:hypothetical protein
MLNEIKTKGEQRIKVGKMIIIIIIQLEKKGVMKVEPILIVL